MSERFQKLISLFILLDDNLLINGGIKWHWQQCFQSIYSLLTFLFHHKQSSFQEQPPFLNYFFVYFDIICSIQNMRCFIKILILDLYFHHHFHWWCYTLLICVLLQRLFECQNSLNWFSKLVICNTFDIVQRTTRCVVSVLTTFKIMDCSLIFLHIEITHSSFLKTSLLHVRFQPLSQCLYCLINHPKLFLRCTFT